MNDPYTTLVALAEQEWCAIGAEAWGELEPLAAQRSALVASLPALPPAGAAPSLQRLAELQALVSAALAAANARGAAELSRLTSRRGAVLGYAAGTHSAAR